MISTSWLSGSEELLNSSNCEEGGVALAGNN